MSQRELDQRLIQAMEAVLDIALDAEIADEKSKTDLAMLARLLGITFRGLYW